MRTSIGGRTSVYAVSGLCALGFLSACGSGEGHPTEATATSSSPSSSPSTSPSAPATMPPNGRARPAVMSGRVTSTDNGCVVFKNDRDAHRWVLIGGPKNLTAGTAYVIQGVAMDAMDPSCPQGLPFQVRDATQAERDDHPVPLPSTSKPSQSLTLTGTVTAGVEAGCRVLRTDDGNFVLMGKVSVADGTRVIVRGSQSAAMMSHCMQGPIIEVHSITPAP